MSRSELEMIADHMGHNLNIHTEIYRLQSSVIEKTKVSRVLLAAEQGLLHKFCGKKLTDISIEGNLLSYALLIN